MYICVCRAVTDGQIREAINNGMCTRKQLMHCFGLGRDCGKCNAEIKELLSNNQPCEYHSKPHNPESSPGPSCGCHSDRVEMPPAPAFHSEAQNERRQ